LNEKLYFIFTYFLKSAFHNEPVSHYNQMYVNRIFHDVHSVYIPMLQLIFSNSFLRTDRI